MIYPPQQTENIISGCIKIQEIKLVTPPPSGDFNNKHYPPNDKQY